MNRRVTTKIILLLAVVLTTVDNRLVAAEVDEKPNIILMFKEAPVLHLEAAFKTSQTKAVVAWGSYDTQGHNPEMKPENHVRFDVVGDGEFRTYNVNLSEVARYKGPMSYTMFRPSLKREQGGWVKVRRIRLGKSLGE